MTFCCTHRLVPCSAIIENLHLPADGSTYRDSKPDITKRYRDLETHSSEMGCLHQILSLWAQETLQKIRQKEYKSQRVWRIPKEQGPINQLTKAHMSSKRLSQQAQGLHQSTSGPLHICYSSHFNTFMELLNVCMRGVSDSCALSWVCFPSVGLSCQCDDLWFILLYFILLYLPQACSFLVRERKGMDPD